MRKTIPIALCLLFALMIVSLIYNNSPLTGFASYSGGINDAIANLTSEQSFKLLGDGAFFCVVVETGNETTKYYEVAKYEGEAYVKESYCADPGQNNVIIKFNSYNDLLEAVQNPEKFIVEKRNTGYYIFPSNYVSYGGAAACSPSFQQKYCGALYAYFSSSEIGALGLPCCAQYTPAGFAFFFGTAAGQGLVFLAILIAIIGMLIWASRRKEK